MNWMKFLGTAGARFVVMKQLRMSGGMWLCLEGTQMMIDPGPGALVRCLGSHPKLNPRELEGIILTHRHLDHANDVNIMIEAMTNGGFDKKGVVFAPGDALDDDPVVLHYYRSHVNKVIRLTEKGSYSVGNLTFSTPVRHVHGVETYGLNIRGAGDMISLIADTQYFKGLERFYPGKVLIVNVVRLDGKPEIQHLSMDDAKRIIQVNQPRVCILTHFGMTVLREKPWEVADRFSKELGIEVVAARDGMTIELDQYL